MDPEMIFTGGVDKINPLEELFQDKTQEQESSDVSDEEMTSPSANTKSEARVSRLALTCFSSNYSSYSFIPYRHLFKNWSDVMGTNLAPLFSNYIRFRYQKVTEEIEIENQRKKEIKYWENLRANFRNFLLRIKDQQ